VGPEAEEGNTKKTGTALGRSAGRGGKLGPGPRVSWHRRPHNEHYSALEDSPLEQVPFGLAQEHWPAEHFGQLGQRSVQLLQYSTGTEVVH